jgi:hypothetical protein
VNTFPPPTPRFQLVTTAIAAEAVAFLESVGVKTMLLGVAATVMELLTANVRVTAAALLVDWARDRGTDNKLSVSTAITSVTFFKIFNLYSVAHSYLTTRPRAASSVCNAGMKGKPLTPCWPQPEAEATLDAKDDLSYST